MSHRYHQPTDVSHFVWSEAPKIGPISAPPGDQIQLEPDKAPGQLLWRLTGKSSEALKDIHPQPDVFQRFLNLSDAPDEKICDFARRNGMLGLCQHGLPFFHGSPTPEGFFEQGRIDCTAAFTKGHWAIVEPLESWRGLSRQAAALMILKLHLSKEGRFFTREDLDDAWANALWLPRKLYEQAGYAGYRSLLRRSRPAESAMPEHIARLANEWLRCGGVLPRLDSKPPGYHLTLALPDSGPNLFGFLAIQLASSVADMRGFAVCAECGEFFQPKKTVSPNRRNFCSKCRYAGKPKAYATRDYRARKKSAGRPKAH